MDKETREEIAKIRDSIEDDHKKWNSFIIKIMAWLLAFFVGIITSGLSCAFYIIHNSHTIRKLIADWWVGK